jgi:two-component system chemotaxis response regulator CheB
MSRGTPPLLNEDRIRRDVVVIGASAGGLAAVIHLLGSLTAPLPAVVAISLHRSATAKVRLVPILARRSTLPVVEPGDGEPIKQGIVYVAPTDRHLILEDGIARLSHGPREHWARPAIDPSFRSAAEAYGSRVVGILLSGLGIDGVVGLRAIKRAGGLSLAQHPKDADFPAMPRNAICYDDVDAVFAVDEIAGALDALVGGGAVTLDPVAHSVSAATAGFSQCGEARRAPPGLWPRG